MDKHLSQIVSDLESLIDKVSGEPTHDHLTINIDDEVEKYLSKEVSESLKNKVNMLSGNRYQVRYLGLRSSDPEDGPKRLAGMVNKYCSAFQSVGSLTGFIKVDLFEMFEDIDKEPEAAYISYIAFTNEAAAIIDLLIKNKMALEFFDEGGAPNKI